MFRRVVISISLAALTCATGCDDDDDNAGTTSDGGGVDGGSVDVARPRTDSGTDSSNVNSADARPAMNVDAPAPVVTADAAPAPSACEAPCLVALSNTFKACAPAGACTESESGDRTNVCFANGVKMTLNQSLELKVFKPAGGLCYTMALDLGSGAHTVKDPSGNALGTVNGDVVTCGGQTYDLEMLGCDVLGGMGEDEEECRAGACNVP